MPAKKLCGVMVEIGLKLITYFNHNFTTIIIYRMIQGFRLLRPLIAIKTFLIARTTNKNNIQKTSFKS